MTNKNAAGGRHGDGVRRLAANGAEQGPHAEPLHRGRRAPRDGLLRGLLPPRPRPHRPHRRLLRLSGGPTREPLCTRHRKYIYYRYFNRIEESEKYVRPEA